MARTEVTLPEDQNLREEVQNWVFQTWSEDINTAKEPQAEFGLPEDAKTCVAAANLMELTAVSLREHAATLSKPVGDPHDEGDGLGLGTGRPEAEETQRGGPEAKG